MEISAYDLASRYIGIHEISGTQDHPLVQWWLSLCGFPTTVHDEIAWCSAFVNGITWELRLPRSKSAAARSWLRVGVPVRVADAQVGYDVVILQRGSGEQPGPEVIEAPGHVGFFAGLHLDKVTLLGGNQGDGVRLEEFDARRVLGVRRLI